MQETAFSKMLQIKNSFSASYWLKAQIQEIQQRDLVDMYHDTLALKELLEALIKETEEPFGLNDFQKSGPYAH